MIGLIAKLKVKPGNETAVKEACLKMAKEVQEKEKGCLLYEPYVSVDNPGEIVFMEKYQDMKALEYHRETPYYKELINTIGSALQGPPEILVLKPLGRE